MKKYLVLLAAVLLQASACAATYTFTGPLYTNLTPFTAPCATPTCADFTTAMRQTGSFATAAPLAPNLVNTNITSLVQSFSFDDGLMQYNSGDSATRLNFAFVSTDAAGNILNENIAIFHWQTASHGVNDRIDVFRVNLSSYFNGYCQALNGSGACTLFGTDASTSRTLAYIGAGGWVTSASPPQVAPTITSAIPPGGTVGVPYHFTVVATGTAPIAFTDAGTLPPGLVIDPNTGVITGTPTSAVNQGVTITANNGVMPSTVQTFMMAIAPAAATSVPTLSEWGLLLMACLVGGAGWWQVRRRATSRWPAA